MLLIILASLSGLLALFGVLGAGMPFINSGAWAVRVWDYPRLQLTIAGLAGAAGLLACTAGLGMRPILYIPAALAVIASIVQGAFIIRYTPLWPKAIHDAEEAEGRLVVANLDFENDRHAEVLDAIRSTDPTVLLVVEYSETWAEQFAGIREDFPHVLEHPRGEGLGIAIFSKIPFDDEEIRHLVSDRRASIHLTLTPEGKPPVRFVGVHPTPPALAVRHGEGRYDSRIRDGELMKVAELILEDPDDSWIIAGDFNDVAWSHTTRLFERVSGLRDPRVGRGLYNTFHAEHRIFRYPLDHVFCSGDFAVAGMGRLRVPGSDHFGVIVDFARDPSETPVEPRPEGDDLEEAEELEEEGEEEADERGE